MPDLQSKEINKSFQFNAIVTKAWFNKELGKHFVKAIASDTGVDHHGERFSERAIDMMAECINKNDPQTVVFLPTHWDTFDIGKVVSGVKIDSPTHSELKALEVDIELDMNYPQASSLYKDVESGNADKQLSVGGYLDYSDENERPYFWEEKEYDMPDGNKIYDYVLVLDKVKLDHIAATRKAHAANDRTAFVEAIAKSLGLEKPEKKIVKQKEVTTMAEAKIKDDKQVDGLMSIIGKTIKNYFSSESEEAQKIEKAKIAVEAARTALVELGENVPDDLVKGLGEFIPVTKNEEAGNTEVPKTEGTVEKTADEKPAEVVETVDVEGITKSITEAVSKSIKEENKAIFEDIAKSLGAVIGATIKSVVDPLTAKIDEIEKAAGCSKGLEGQEALESTSEKNVTEKSEEGMWDGIILKAIPKELLAEKKYKEEE